MEEVEPDYLSFLLESYIEILQIEIMRYKAKNTANENLIQQLKTEIDEYRIKLEEIKNQVAIPDDVVEGSLEDKYFKLRNEMTKLKAQLRTKEYQIKELNSYIKQLKNEQKELQNEIADLRVKLAERKK
ncbi:MAG: hypothetical protein ACTSYB_05690 [Candidatus Helarchaeota archaeon]